MINSDMKVIFYHNTDLYLDLKKASGQLRPQHPEDIKPRLFTKYFPKYLQKLSLDLRKGPIRSKIKRTKVIQEFDYPFTFYHRSDWRILLGNKIKTIKAMNNSSQSEQQFVQKLKLVHGLKSLCVDLSMIPVCIFMQDRDLLKISWKKINCLRNLQFLSISNLTKENKTLLQKLGQSSRFLNSLREFCIIFQGRASFGNSELLQIIGSKENVLKSVTSLNLGSLCSPSHFTDFQSLANSFSKLRHLAFQFSCKSISYNPFTNKNSFGMDFPVETNYLATLKTFHNLKSLHLNIADTFTCLKDLILPPLIQHLTLNFQQCLSKEIMMKIDPAFTKNDPQLFEENETLLQFYDRFRCLGSLETLRIDFNRDSNSESCQYQSYLLHSLLKRIPTLKKFTSETSDECLGLNPTFLLGIKDPYLPEFFKSCHHLSQDLQTVEIGDAKFMYSDFDLSASRNKFPQLSSIKFTGQFEEFDEFEPDIPALLEQLVLLGDPIVSRIKLSVFIENTVESLLALFQQISHVKVPEKLHLEIEVNLLGTKNLKNMEEGFEDEIEKIIEQGRIKFKRTSLKIHARVSCKQMKKFLDTFGERFESFEIVSLS